MILRGIYIGLALWAGIGSVLAARGPWTANVDKAIAVFEQALRDDPNDVDAAIGLGQALAKKGRRDEAAARFRGAIALAPGRWQGYAYLADLVADHPRRWQEREEITELLARGLDRVAGDPVGRVGLTISFANFERSIGRTTAARARLEALATASLLPEQRKRVLDLVETIRTEERARALKDWPEPAVDEATRRALALAEGQLGRGRAREAIAEAERIARAQPGWWAPRWLRARALLQLGRFDEAERDLTVVVQLSPSHAAAWRRLGQVLVAHGGVLDVDRADEALRHALALEPGWWDLWLLRARVAVRRGHPDEAERAVERYLKNAPERTHDPEVESVLVAARAQATQAAEPRRSARPAQPPSPNARQLYRDAQSWLEIGDPAALAEPLLLQAIEDSPGYIAAAASLYAVTSRVPERTVKAIWSDGDALLELARKVRALGHGPKERAIVRPWLDRALALGVGEARFDRALVREEDGDSPGALSDLRDYVAMRPQPAQLEEARGLLAALAGDGTRGGEAARVLARVRLLADRPGEAADMLGGRCDEELPLDRLVPLGVVHEWSGDLPRALECYRAALRRAEDGEKSRDREKPISPIKNQKTAKNGDASGVAAAASTGRGVARELAQSALARIAGVGARAPVALVTPLEKDLVRAAAADVAAADWALARLLLARGDGDAALARVDRYLQRAAEDDPNRAAAQAARAGIVAARDRVARLRLLKYAGAAAAVLLMIVGFVLLRFRGATLARALARRPALFPEVARTIAELRHDVLKHRTSVLSVIAAPPEPSSSAAAAAGGDAARAQPLPADGARGASAGKTLPLAADKVRGASAAKAQPLAADGARGASAAKAQVEQVARVLWEPERASDVVAASYEKLRDGARGAGLTLRRLASEPTFGALVADLRKAETLVRRPSLSEADTAQLARIDERLRAVHSEKLASLLRLSPRTRVDAQTVSDWIRAVEAELRVRGAAWALPVLELHGLELDFPVEKTALATIFANLLRNAQAVVGEAPSGPRSVLVRVGEERDAMGRRLLVLAVGDTAARELTLGDIEARESGRGLAIVRDLVHEWRGHVIVRRETAPFTKGVGACFPA